MFEIFGKYRGRVVDVSWDAGKIGGDVQVVQEVQDRAAVLEGESVGLPTGPFTRENHLSNPLSALLIMKMVLDEVGILRGDVPFAPSSGDSDAKILY